ncbi:MAG: ABC transporter substrate-binding protein [Spirochaetaceae bacterium]|nr:MAG: ABC transporter substrate-binding protein [Spirochaetaceae bacterium]
MRVHKVTVLVVLVAASLSSTAWAAGVQQQAAVPETRTIVDSAGRAVAVPLEVTRAVVLSTAAAEVIRAIGAEESIIAVSGSFREGPLWGDFSELPRVSATALRDIDYEAILALAPDIVIGYGTHPAADVQAMSDALSPAGIAVAGIDCYKFETLPDEITTLGVIFGRITEAAEYREYLTSIDETVRAIGEAVPRDQRVRVFAQHHGGDYRAMGAGSEWTMMIEAAGGINVFAEFSPASSFDIDTERLIEINPDVFLVDARSVPRIGFGVTDSSEAEQYFQERRDRAGWHLLSFAQYDRMHAIAGDIGGGPTKFLGMAFFARLLQPDLFPDLNPDALLTEYYRRFHSLVIEGIFAWPPTW